MTTESLTGKIDKLSKEFHLTTTQINSIWKSPAFNMNMVVIA